jgi:hypothetical protein
VNSITNKSIPILITSIALLSVCNGTDLTTFNRREARTAIIHRLVALQQVTVEGQRRELDIRGNSLVIDAGFRCGDGVVRYASSWRDHAGAAVQEVDVYMAGEYERLSARKFGRFDKWLLPGQVDYYLQESGATPIVHNSRTVISRYVLNDIDNTIENLRVSNTAGVRWYHQDNNDGFIGVGLRDSGLGPVVDRIVSGGLLLPESS